MKNLIRLCLLALTLLSFGLPLMSQEEPLKREESLDRPCLVFADGRKVLLESLPDVDGSLVHFTLESGKGPFTVRKNDLDWAATEAGCPLPLTQAQVQAIQGDPKVITTEDLGKGGGGGAFSVDGSSHSGFPPPLQSPGRTPSAPPLVDQKVSGEEPSEERNWEQEWNQIKIQLRLAQDIYLIRFDELERMDDNPNKIPLGLDPDLLREGEKARFLAHQKARENMQVADKELKAAKLARDDFKRQATKARVRLDWTFPGFVDR